MLLSWLSLLAHAAPSPQVQVRLSVGVVVDLSSGIGVQVEGSAPVLLATPWEALGQKPTGPVVGPYAQARWVMHSRPSFAFGARAGVASAFGDGGAFYSFGEAALEGALLARLGSPLGGRFGLEVQAVFVATAELTAEVGGDARRHPAAALSLGLPLLPAGIAAQAR